MAETPPEQHRWHRIFADGRILGGIRVSTVILSLLFVITSVGYLAVRPVAPAPVGSVTISRSDVTTEPAAPPEPVQTTTPRPSATTTTAPPTTTATEEPAPTTTTPPPTVPGIPGFEIPQIPGLNAPTTTTATPAP